MALPENFQPDLRYTLDLRLWRQTEAKGELQRLIDESKHRYVQPLVIATFGSLAGDERLYREWLEIAYRRHDPALVWLALFRTHDPWMREVVKRMGLNPIKDVALSSAQPRQ